MTTGTETKPRNVGEPLKTTKKSDRRRDKRWLLYLYRDAFNVQKEITLGIIRHEMTHAKHHMDTLDLVQNSGTRKSKPPILKVGWENRKISTRLNALW